MAEKLLCAILGGFILWMIKEIFDHKRHKDRLKGGLLADIQLHLQGVEDQCDAVNQLVNNIVVGEKISLPISYTPDTYAFYTAVQSMLARYLEKDELVKVIKFYQAIKHLDIAINGLTQVVSLWERDGTVIDGEKLEYLDRRRARIDSFQKLLLSADINELSDLPDDYTEIKTPDTVVANNSEVTLPA